jgi:hypothetical protein
LHTHIPKLQPNISIIHPHPLTVSPAQGGARTTVVLFSKLQLKRFPHPSALATFLKQQLSLVRQVNIDLICIR